MAALGLRAIRAQTRLFASPPTALRFRRFNSTQESPASSTSQAISNPSTDTSNAHREFYRGPGRAIAWNFLIAMATFQVLYWSWLKLEAIEVKQEKEKEMHLLEGQLKSLVKEQLKK